MEKTKMRVLLSFEFNDVEPGSNLEDYLVSRLEKLARELRNECFKVDADSISVHDVHFYSTDMGGWV